MGEPITWTNETRRLDELQPWPRNPRQINKDQAKRLAQSFDEFGQVETIAIGPGNEVYNGHQRLSVLMDKHGGAYEVEVRVSSRPLSEKEREKLTVFLHKGAAGEWNFDALANEFEVPELLEWGFDEKELQLGGFELDQPEGEDPGAQVDKAEELRQKWGVETGQLWRLGEHRLICGDCTDRAVVEKVMGGEKARLCFTSPPYADQRTYEIGEFDWLALMNGCTTLLFEICGNPGDVIINLGMSYKDGRVNFYWNDWLDYCEKLQHPLFGWYVWDKGSGLPGEWNGRLAPAHEWLFHFSVGRKSANKWIETKPESRARGSKGSHTFRQKDGSLNEATSPDKIGQAYKVPDSVVRVNKQLGPLGNGLDHPAVFSVDFAEFCVQTWSDAQNAIYEPFSGSGTTLIACERLGRKCRAVEISPAYCAVAIQRWVDMTGGVPELIAS